ncbi:hypothetical protein [Cellulophaga baltica]|uniref:hypothetical protein n=1 Tax=Cellulophaga baltica TaxID=76594 RepID=UPI000404F46F|nr:hypothetical protein [Cellulophaga baltica]WFO17143.1 hypothetical protein M601_005245 [Cellulophaga baltica 4]
MKIKYKKKRNYINLTLGLFWILLGVISLIQDDAIRWTDYGYLLAGTLYIGQFLWNITNQYLTVENGIIKKNTPYGKKIKLNEINWIKKFAGDYTLKTETEELKINTELIEKNSLAELICILEKLNLPADKTPFASIVQK